MYGPQNCQFWEGGSWPLPNDGFLDPMTPLHKQHLDCFRCFLHVSRRTDTQTDRATMITVGQVEVPRTGPSKS